MTNFKIEENIEMSALKIHINVVNNLKNSSILQRIGFIFFAVYFILFIGWIFLNIINKREKLLTRFSMYLYCFNQLISLICYIFISLDYDQQDFKNITKDIYCRLSITDFGRYFIYFSIADLLSVIFLTALILYRNRFFLKNFTFKNLSFEMKIFIIFKMFLYIIHLVLIGLYLSINDKTSEIYLLIYKMLFLIFDILSKSMTLIIIYILLYRFNIAESGTFKNVVSWLNNQQFEDNNQEEPFSYTLDYDSLSLDSIEFFKSNIVVE